MALIKAGHEIISYHASEIHKQAIKVAKLRHPDIIHVGDVRNVRIIGKNWFDILLAGSPCQGLSFAGLMRGFDDPRSALFFEFLRIYRELKRINPNLILVFENVRMLKEIQDYISDQLCMKPIFIDSELVSSCHRKRNYWTSIQGITMPEQRGLVLRDILETEGVGIKRRNDEFIQIEKGMNLDANYRKGLDAHQARTGVYMTAEQVGRAESHYAGKTFDTGKSRGKMNFPDSINKKGKALICRRIPTNRHTHHIHCVNPRKENGTQTAELGPRTSVQQSDMVRLLTVTEGCRIMGLPDDYCDGISESAAFHCLGNGWQVDTVAHIMSFIK